MTNKREDDSKIKDLDQNKHLDVNNMDNDKKVDRNFESITLSFLNLFKKRKYGLPFSLDEIAQKLPNIYNDTTRFLSLRAPHSDKLIIHFSRGLNPPSNSKRSPFILPLSLIKPIKRSNFSLNPNENDSNRKLEDDRLKLVHVLHNSNNNILENDLNYFTKVNKDRIIDISNTIHTPFSTGLDSKNIKTISKDPTTIIRDERSDLGSNSNLKIYSDDKTSKILRTFNADAMTLGQNILFSKDKFNLRTPTGFALLIHELTHVQQLRESNSLYSNESGIKTNKQIPSSLWEKEALDNEKLSLKYYKYLDKKQVENSSLKYGLKKSIHNNGMNDHIQGNSHNVGTVNNGITGHKNDDLDVDLSYTKARIDDLTKPVSIERTNNSSFSGPLEFGRGESKNDLETNNKPDKTFSEISSPFNNDIGVQDYSKSFNISVPYLSFGDTLETGGKVTDHLSLSDSNNVFPSSPSPPLSNPPLFYIPSSTSSTFPSLPSQPSSNSIPYSGQLFAETNRAINSSENPQSPITQNQILPTPASNGHSTLQLNSLDLESIAEKVYQLIQSNIKIQKARIGIR